MSVPLLDELVSAGVKLWVNGDELKIRAPRKGMLTPDVVEQLRTLKPTIIAELRNADEQASTTDEQPQVAGVVASDDAAVDDAEAFLEPEERDGTAAFTDDAEAVEPEPHIVAQIAAWRDEIERLPAPEDRDIDVLLRAARDFLDGSHTITAIEHGWDERELFGVHLFAPRIRLDAWGLVAHLAWSRLPGPSQIMALDHDEATFQTTTGATLKIKRRPTGYLNAKPFWTLRGKDNE